MADYVIFSDATGDLTPDLIAQADVTIMPMSFVLEGKNYQNTPDNREMDPDEFYDKLRAGSVATTSQINCETLKDHFRPVLAAGQDLLYLAFSSGLSGTCAAGMLAAEDLKEEFPDRQIRCVDTLNAAMGEGLVVYLAAMQRKAGKSMDEVAAYVQEHIYDVNSWFTVDDLMFLKRGGRLSGAAAMAGTLLGIKPILHVDKEGHLIAMEKVRGRKASLDALVKHYKEHGVDKADYPVFLGHGGCLTDAEYVAERCKEAGAPRVCIGPIGPVIGSHSGPGTIALFFWGDGR